MLFRSDLTAKILKNSSYTGIINFELHIQKTPFFDPSKSEQSEEILNAYMHDVRERCFRFAEMMKN